MLQMQGLRAIACFGRPALTVVSAVILVTGIVRADSRDEEAVRKAVNGFAEAWNSHDMNAFGALFAPDADFVAVTGVYWKGRNEIQLNHEFTHGTIPIDSAGITAPRGVYGVFKSSTLQIKQIDIRFLRKDVAVAHAQTELLGDARTKNPRRTLAVMILTREAGRWLVAVVQNTEINRPPELNR